MAATTQRVLLAFCLVAAAAAQYLTFQYPPLGTYAPITGSVTGLPLPANQYKVGILVSSTNGAVWWDKTHDYPNGVPLDVVLGIPLNADYTFRITGWVSDPNDLTAGLIRVIIVPQSFSFLWPGYQVEGIPYPQFLTAATVAMATIDRNAGTWTRFPAGAAPGPPTPKPETPAPITPAPITPAPVTPPPVPGGGATLQLTAFPTPGTMNPISGVVSGLTNPTGYKVILYLQGGGGTWWIKPNVGMSAGLNAAGTFTIANWATYPPGDVNFQAFQMYVVPAATAVVNVLGGQLPASIDAASVAKGNFPRGYTVPVGPTTPTPVPPVTPTTPPGGGGVTLFISAFPAPGTLTPVGGMVYGLANPTAHKAVMYLQGGGTWWVKPQPGMSTTLGADGSFAIANWASYPPGDVNFQQLAVFIVPAATAVVNVLGAPALPQVIDTAAVAKATLPRGYTPGGPQPTGTPVPTVAPPTVAPPTVAPPTVAPPTTAPGNAALAITAFPAPGTLNPISGKVTGLTNAGGYKCVLYLKGGDGNWWSKPQPGMATNLGADGSFTVNNWASYPAGDMNFQAMQLYIVPAATTVVSVLGGQLPASVDAAAVVKGIFQSGYAPGGGVVTPTPIPPTEQPPTGGTGELAWPPSAVPSAKVGQQGGFINFAGYRWLVKDSGGGRVGPGPNVFSNSINNVWVDNWGAHLNVWPANGCGGWTCSEMILDHTLGYGTYLFRYVSIVEQSDPDIVWSPFFLWDDSGGAYNAWREIDFEVARWSNQGDPTSSQFVLRPLQAGPMVPGWRVRYPTRELSIWQGQGQGGGQCNYGGQGEFGGAATSKVTCALKWFQGRLSWYCVDGHYTLQTFGQVPANKRTASYFYQHPQYVPDVGDNRVHFNHWISTGGVPRFGRRAHGIIAGFEFSNNDVAFPNFPANQDLGLTQRFLLAAPPSGDDGRRLEGEEEVSPAAQSNGDPTGDGIRATMAFIQAAAYEAASAGGGGGRVLAQSGGGGGGGGDGDNFRISRLLAGAAIFGGLVGMATMFFAGYTIARGGGRAPIAFVKRTLMGSPRTAGTGGGGMFDTGDDSGSAVQPDHTTRSGTHWTRATPQH